MHRFNPMQVKSDPKRYLPSRTPDLPFITVPAHFSLLTACSLPEWVYCIVYIVYTRFKSSPSSLSFRFLDLIFVGKGGGLAVDGLSLCRARGIVIHLRSCRLFPTPHITYAASFQIPDHSISKNSQCIGSQPHNYSSNSSTGISRPIRTGSPACRRHPTTPHARPSADSAEAEEPAEFVLIQQVLWQLPTAD